MKINSSTEEKMSAKFGMIFFPPSLPSLIHNNSASTTSILIEFHKESLLCKFHFLLFICFKNVICDKKESI